MVFTLVPLYLYTPVYYWLMFTICILTGWYYTNSVGCRKLLIQNSGMFAFVLAIPLAFYVGCRPVSGRYFADMKMYAYLFDWMKVNTFVDMFSFSSEWVFDFLMRLCKRSTRDVHVFFLMVDLIYFGCQLWACKKLLKENAWLAILFVFFSYQFFTYSTNGIRNGMACSLMMLAMAFIADRNKRGYLIGGFLCVLAIGTHRSVMIPISAIIAAIYFVKNTRQAILIWVACIFLSLIAGGFFQGLFQRLGFDDRMTSYSTYDMSRFSHSGFRWDFLLYSAMPIWLAKYVSDKGIKDATFSLLANTYIIANSFWVLVCRMAYSNRFAYLSWFMYGLVIAYAVIRVPIWKDQDKKCGLILMAHTAFTMGMFLIGK